MHAEACVFFLVLTTALPFFSPKDCFANLSGIKRLILALPLNWYHLPLQGQQDARQASK
jgi:hypothetical protein